MAGWRSVHLFHSHAEHADRLALAADEVMREAASNPADWFFIRYAEGGPHVRVRIGPSNGVVADAIVARLGAQCAKIASVAGAVPVSGYPDEGGRLFAPGKAVEIAYQPELVRYGGPAAIVKHEKLFRRSTAIATSAVRRLPEIGQRGQLAVDLLLGAAAALAAAGQGTAGDFIRYYCASWRSLLLGAAGDEEGQPGRRLAQVPVRLLSLATFLRRRAPPGSLAQHWTHELAATLSALLGLHRRDQLLSPLLGRPPAGARELEEAMFHMMFSQSHMLCNRIGLAPAQELAIAEMLLASVVEEGLGDATAQPAAGTP